MNTPAIWLTAGVLFLAAEALGVSGIGLLFAGLGAIVVGVTINFSLIPQDAHILQFVVFFISTAAWVLILWKPMQRFKLSRQHTGYSNIVGETATVSPKGVNKNDGEVSWSGTLMKARLAKSVTQDTLPAGSLVTIVEVHGATLVVKPKE